MNSSIILDPQVRSITLPMPKNYFQSGGVANMSIDDLLVTVSDRIFLSAW